MSLSTDQDFNSFEFKGFRIFTTPYYKDKINELINNFDKKCNKYSGRASLYQFDNFIIREYLHGGVFRGLFKNNFISENRFLKEFQIHHYLNSVNFPTTEVVAIISKREIFAHGFIVTINFESLDMISFLKENLPKRDIANLLFKMGEISKSLHNHNIIHSDLHLKNFITKDNIVKLIDFDKSFYSDDLYYKKRDIERFMRSLKKYNHYNSPQITSEMREKFFEGYGVKFNITSSLLSDIKNRISWKLNHK